MNIAAITAKLGKGEKLTAEERAFLDAHLNAQDNAQPTASASPTGRASASPLDTTVDLASLSPEVRALVEQAQSDAANAATRAERAETTANSERNTRLEREFRERALGLGQPEAFGATLRAASEKLSAEEYAAFESSLRATHARADILGEQGSTRDNRAAGDVFVELSSRVQAVMKDNPGLSKAQASEKVMKDDPEFAKRYARAAH